MDIRYGLVDYLELPVSIRSRSSFGNISSVPESFYLNLLNSVEREGFRNPILLENQSGELKVVYGESRCWVAYQLKIKIPAFINDYQDKYKDLELIVDETQARAKFKDKPTKFRFTKPIFFCGCPLNW